MPRSMPIRCCFAGRSAIFFQMLCGTRADKGLLTISIEQDAQNNAVFTVSDTGIGIHPDDIPNIFNRFFRAESARTLDATGSGLGLAIVKSIMDLHGGTIDIKSEPLQGTSVTLLFPHAA